MSPTLITGPGVWMEGEALRQLDRAAALPGCRSCVGMPDLHAGLHGPIGIAIAVSGAAWPSLIGGDAGCGARLVGIPSGRMAGDALERRVDEATRGAALPDVDDAALFAAAWAVGPRGLCGLDGVPEALQAIAADEPEDTDGPSAGLPPDADTAALGASLGSTGGGNHFMEVSAVERVQDRALAARAGLVPGGMAVLAHSGSRGLGALLAARWPRDAIADDGTGPTTPLADWLAELRGAVRYARVNRLLLTWRLLQALGAARPGKIGGSFDVVHNTVVPGVHEGQPVWIHRKGCAPAASGQLTVVLGSRGTYSWVMEGCGHPGALASVAHGAGRKMTRSEATAKVKAHHTRASLTRTPLGGRVLYDDPALLYEEHPDAYKAIDPVVDALEAFGAARRVAALRPVLTVKR